MIDITGVDDYDGLPNFAVYVKDLPSKFYLRGAEYPFDLKETGQARLQKMAISALDKVIGKGSVKSASAYCPDVTDHEVIISVTLSRPTKERAGYAKWRTLNRELHAATTKRLPIRYF